MWISWGADVLLHLDLPKYGIISRTIIGLRGIVFAPYIHDNRNVMHILSNTPPFMVLFFLLQNAFRKIALPVYILIQVLSGFMLWLFGPGETVTVGMSGVIFGMASFLIGSGIFRRNLISIALALMVIFFYGGSLAASILPNQPGVSWQDHVCGAIAGLFVAFNLRNYDRAPTVSISSSDDGHFFDRHP
jgi:membrane associated rhomboid family serine protease